MFVGVIVLNSHLISFDSMLSSSLPIIFLCVGRCVSNCSNREQNNEHYRFRTLVFIAPVDFDVYSTNFGF